MLKGYAVNKNAVSEQKYEELKKGRRAVGKRIQQGTAPYIAESRTEEMATMVKVVVSLINRKNG